MTLNQATALLDTYADRVHLTTDVQLAEVRRALEVVHTAANQ